MFCVVLVNTVVERHIFFLFLSKNIATSGNGTCDVSIDVRQCIICALILKVEIECQCNSSNLSFEVMFPLVFTSL